MDSVVTAQRKAAALAQAQKAQAASTAARDAEQSSGLLYAPAAKSAVNRVATDNSWRADRDYAQQQVANEMDAKIANASSEETRQILIRNKATALEATRDKWDRKAQGR